MNQEDSIRSTEHDLLRLSRLSTMPGLDRPSTGRSRMGLSGGCGSSRCCNCRKLRTSAECRRPCPRHESRVAERVSRLLCRRLCSYRNGVVQNTRLITSSKEEHHHANGFCREFYRLDKRKHAAICWLLDSPTEAATLKKNV
jgi:hypothetical protein